MSEVSLVDLARRMERIEDEQAIRNILARYCLAADAGDAEGAQPLFAEDAKADIDQAVFMNGAAEISASFKSAAHQAMLPNGAHVTGPFLVEIEGSKAVATGYMTLYFKQETVGLVRLSLGRWEFAKTDGDWKVTKRIARSVGRDDTSKLIETARQP